MVNIDCNYIIRVADYMNNELPRPSKKLIDNDGSILPLILVTVELW